MVQGRRPRRLKQRPLRPILRLRRPWNDEAQYKAEQEADMKSV